MGREPGTNGVSAAAGVETVRERRAAADPAPGTWDYAPAPETVKVEIKPRYDHFIAGRWMKARSRDAGAHFDTINPATEDVLAQVSQGSDADVDAAVRAAREALPAWAGLPPTERAKYIFRIARRIQERARELAVLETLDSGKPIKESRDVDIPLVASHFFYHAGWADKLQYAFAGATPRPIGVCGQIIPWNFPLLMAAWKLAPALACGNTVVLKPAETTPLTALRLAEILEEIELPAGVVNIVTGDGRTGAALVNHPGVDKIAFTGSTEVGKKIAAATAARGTKLTLELGGKSANIIFEDASLDQAVEGIIGGIFFNQGEVCCAGSRLLVQESILGEVVKKLRIRMASLRVGNPIDKNTDVGAVNSRAQLDRIRHYLTIGPEEGAELCVGGQVMTQLAAQGAAHENGTGADLATRDGLPGKGFYCRPCFFTGVQPSHTVAREEIFGPVLSVMSFRTPEEAINRANNTPYGLAAGVWTDKGSKIFEIARKLKAGVVWCNTYNKFDPASPFGGYKESGFGREGGVQGLRGYVRLG
ncbi:MAG: aldehyde dehydrogenase family protein [Phycisphaerales bacterium]|nr:aldehyde dehydrogenase family protein [Phycisphaerales bacterium]